MWNKREIAEFWRYIRAVLLKPSWEFITTGTLFTSLFVLTWWRDNTAPEDLAKKWDIRKFLPHWPPLAWLCIGLFILLFLVIQSSYKLFRQQRKEIEHLRAEPLPTTAPQVSLVSELISVGEKIRNFVLLNVSDDENIYNICFQPTRTPLGMFITWHPESKDILAHNDRLVISPLVTVPIDGNRAETYKTVESLHNLLVEREAKLVYDIGPIAFSCEDSRQNRYLVTFSVSLNQGGDRATVCDLDRRRIGSRPSN